MHASARHSAIVDIKAVNRFQSVVDQAKQSGTLFTLISCGRAVSTFLRASCSRGRGSSSSDLTVLKIRRTCGWGSFKRSIIFKSVVEMRLQSNSALERKAVKKAVHCSVLT